MWHEARKQEKKIRGIMVDYKKRAERRRDFYEKTKLDPTQFLRMYGRPQKIHLDQSVTLAAESPQSMMAWQGDSNVKIDRFDVRAHLDSLPETTKYKAPPLTKDEEEEERQTNYERYRILVHNECAGLSEEQHLHEIYIDEQFGPPDIEVEKQKEEKKKLAEGKAAIGYTYEDATPVYEKGNKKRQQEEEVEEEEEEEDEESSDEEIDLDLAFDVETLTDEQIEMLNGCSVHFGMKATDYSTNLFKDKEEAEQLKLAKMLEEEKAQFAGRKSRRERRAFKEKRLKDRTMSPPSYAARDSPKYEPYRESSSSRSRSPSPARRMMYITSFGDSDEEAGVVQGPMLPPHLQLGSSDSRKNTSRLNRGSRSPSPTVGPKLLAVTPNTPPSTRSPKNNKRSRPSASRSSSRSRSRSRRSRSGSRSRRSRSRSRRSRSRSRRRSRSRSWSRSRRSWSRSRRSRSRSRRSWSRSRRRSRSNGRRRRSYSRSYSRSRSRSRGRRSRSYRSRSYSRSHSRSRSRSRKRYSRSRSRSRSKSRSRSRDRHTAKSSPPLKRYRRPSLSSKSSEDSDSDEENSKSKMSITDRMDSLKRRDIGRGLGKNEGTTSKTKLTPADKLKRRMQMALNRQYKADKKAQQVKIEKQEQERLDREDDLRARAIEMRRREREKRHKEIGSSEEEDDDDHSVHKHRSRSRSPGHRKPRSRSRSKSPRKAKQRSRSRSRSPHHRSSRGSRDSGPVSRDRDVRQSDRYHDNRSERYHEERRREERFRDERFRDSRGRDDRHRDSRGHDSRGRSNERSHRDDRGRRDDRGYDRDAWRPRLVDY